MYAVEPFRMHCLVACPGNRPELDVFDRRSSHLFFFHDNPFQTLRGTTDHLPRKLRLKRQAPSLMRDDHCRSNTALRTHEKMLTTGYKSNDHLEWPKEKRRQIREEEEIQERLCAELS